jgi:hypothetical protein
MKACPILDMGSGSNYQILPQSLLKKEGGFDPEFARYNNDGAVLDHKDNVKSMITWLPV